MDYQLEIKQIVDYPRCRMYREFIRRIMEDRNIRTNGSSYLFYFVILCSYVNFRSSYRRLDGITYLVEPGQWICTAAELSEWFRTRFQHQAISILDTLKKQHYITYSKLGRGNLIKFSIIGWKTSNTALEYNYPCLKDVGFFFFPIAAAHELISLGKASEMDIVLDLWLHTIIRTARCKAPIKARSYISGMEPEIRLPIFRPGAPLGSIKIYSKQNFQQTGKVRLSLPDLLSWQTRERHLPK